MGEFDKRFRSVLIRSSVAIRAMLVLLLCIIPLHIEPLLQGPGFPPPAPVTNAHGQVGSEDAAKANDRSSWTWFGPDLEV